MNPKVSIIVPVYNYPDVTKALDSIPRREDIELIVIDDGSTDGTSDILTNYALLNTDLRIKLCRNEENRGVGYTKNKCYDMAKGEYIYLLDSDDWLYTDIFEKALNELDGTDLIYVSPQINNGDILRLTPETKNMWVAGHTRFIRREFMGDNRTKEDDWKEDLYFHNLLQTYHPTEKFTDLVPYHYNWPHKWSLLWNVEHGYEGNNRDAG